MLQKINKWNQRLRKKWFQGLVAKAWGHLCHSGAEVETAERRPKLNVSNSITFALSKLVLTASPGSTSSLPLRLDPLRFLRTSLFNSEGIYCPKEL